MSEQFSKSLINSVARVIRGERVKILNSDVVGSPIYYKVALPKVLAFQKALIFVNPTIVSGPKSGDDSEQL